MALTFTPITSYSFSGANQSPLDPANWESIGGDLPDEDQIQILNGVATTTIEVQDDGTTQNLNTWPNDQYEEFQLKQLGSNGAFFMYIRAADQLLPCYHLDIGGPFGGGLANYSIGQFDGDDNDTHDWVTQQPIDLHVNDVVRFGVMGGQVGGIIVFQVNGVTIFQGNLSDSSVVLTGGTLGFQLATITPAVTDIGVVNWVGGSMSNGGGGGGGTDDSPNPEIQMLQNVYGVNF